MKGGKWRRRRRIRAPRYFTIIGAMAFPDFTRWRVALNYYRVPIFTVGPVFLYRARRSSRRFLLGIGVFFFCAKDNRRASGGAATLPDIQRFCSFAQKEIVAAKKLRVQAIQCADPVSR